MTERQDGCKASMSAFEAMCRSGAGCECRAHKKGPYAETPSAAPAPQEGLTLRTEWGIRSLCDGTHKGPFKDEAEAREWVARFPQAYVLVSRQYSKWDTERALREQPAAPTAPRGKCWVATIAGPHDHYNAVIQWITGDQDTALLIEQPARPRITREQVHRAITRGYCRESLNTSDAANMINDMADELMKLLGED